MTKLQEYCNKFSKLFPQNMKTVCRDQNIQLKKPSIQNACVHLNFILTFEIKADIWWQVSLQYPTDQVFLSLNQKLTQL